MSSASDLLKNVAQNDVENAAVLEIVATARAGFGDTVEGLILATLKVLHGVDSSLSARITRELLGPELRLEVAVNRLIHETDLEMSNLWAIIRSNRSVEEVLMSSGRLGEVRAVNQALKTVVPFIRVWGNVTPSTIREKLLQVELPDEYKARIMDAVNGATNERPRLGIVL